MPNHVSQALVVLSGDIDKIKSAVKGNSEDGQTIWFCHESFFPMPQELKGTISGTKEIVPDEEYAQLLEGRTREDVLADQKIWDCGLPISESMAEDFKARFGCTNWYEWAKSNWGTKWGVYESSEWKTLDAQKVKTLIPSGADGDVALPAQNEAFHCISFESAWSPATKIIQKLSQDFPEAKFMLAAIDEGYNFAGVDGIIDGRLVFERNIECDDESELFKKLADLVGFEIYQDEED